MTKKQIVTAFVALTVFIAAGFVHTFFNDAKAAETKTINKEKDANIEKLMEQSMAYANNADMALNQSAYSDVIKYTNEALECFIAIENNVKSVQSLSEAEKKAVIDDTNYMKGVMYLDRGIAKIMSAEDASGGVSDLHKALELNKILVAAIELYMKNAIKNNNTTAANLFRNVILDSPNVSEQNKAYVRKLNIQ